MKGLIKVTLFLFIALVYTLGTHAQTGRSATLKGKVTDSTDAVVPNIPIAFTNDVRSYKI